MKCFYSDIIEKCGEPQWWDEVGVPRYCNFDPKKVNDIYAREVAFLRIRCQSCHKEFLVAISWCPIHNLRNIAAYSERKKGDIYYRDPPRHDIDGRCCAGETMTSETLEVIELWKSDIGKWTRLTEFEGVVENQLPSH